MHDTFMFTKPLDFSTALGVADKDKVVTNSARSVALSTTMRKAMDGALLTENVTLGEVEDGDVELPMTDTTFMLPEKTTVNNASFNADGHFADRYSLVTRYLQLSDFASKTAFEDYDAADQHTARSSQHASIWVVFTMGVNKTTKDLDTKKTHSPAPKGAAFSLTFG